MADREINMAPVSGLESRTSSAHPVKIFPKQSSACQKAGRMGFRHRLGSENRAISCRAAWTAFGRVRLSNSGPPIAIARPREDRHAGTALVDSACRSGCRPECGHVYHRRAREWLNSTAKAASVKLIGARVTGLFLRVKICADQVMKI